MFVVSLTPQGDGHCLARMYSCEAGTRMKLQDLKFDRVPTIEEVREMQKRPLTWAQDFSDGGEAA